MNFKINLQALNRKIQREIVVNNLLESQKYLQLDGKNQVVENLYLNGNIILDLGYPVEETDGANTITFDSAVNWLTEVINVENVLHNDGSNQPTANISWDGFKFETFENPQNPQDSTNKKYVDQLILVSNENINNKAMLLDGTIQPTQDINWNHNKIKHSKDPTDNVDAVNIQHLNLMFNKKTSNYNLGNPQEDLRMYKPKHFGKNFEANFQSLTAKLSEKNMPEFLKREFWSLSFYGGTLTFVGNPPVVLKFPIDFSDKNGSSRDMFPFQYILHCCFCDSQMDNYPRIYMAFGKKLTLRLCQMQMQIKEWLVWTKQNNGEFGSKLIFCFLQNLANAWEFVYLDISKNCKAKGAGRDKSLLLYYYKTFTFFI